MSDSEKYKHAERQIEHPLDDIFDVNPGQTVVQYEERIPTDLVEHETFDEKDQEIENQMQEVYELALEAFENANDTVESIDPKYRARTSEVACTYLSLALNAARDKANMKSGKDKLEKMGTRSGDAASNNIIMSREDLLALMDAEEEKIADSESVDAEYTEVDDSTDS